MKAREFLAQRGREQRLRDLIKQPLTFSELRELARRTGGAEALIAPKKRKEAAGLSGEALLRWLAEDGGRVRRPIIEIGGVVTLGFAADAREKLAALL